MAKAELKTKQNDASVLEFLRSVEDENKRKDALEVHSIMETVTGERGKMWGNSIVGYGACRLKYASGRELDWMLTGFSPRKQAISLYIMDGFKGYEELLGKLGEHKTGKSCLYIKRLADIDLAVLRKLIKASVAHMREKHKEID